MKKQISTLLLLLIFMPSVQANSVIGFWKTIDDESGKEKSIVELYEKQGRIVGRIVDLLLKPDDSLCKECEGKLHNQPIVGMQIVNGLQEDDGQYSGGDILDPENGKTYRCKLWLEGDELKVRGYIGFFFRTQTWHKTTAPK